MRSTKWSQFKPVIEGTKATFACVSYDEYYFLICNEYQLDCKVSKTDPKNDDQIDYEDNYHDHANQPVFDRSGRKLVRNAIAEKGNALQWLSCHFTLGKHAQFECRHSDGATNVSGFTYKIYSASGSEITSSANEADAVKSVITFHPSFDLEMMAASLRQIVIPTTEIEMYMVINPDEIYGSKYEMVTGGHDLRFFPAAIPAFVDGKSPKFMMYDPVYNTNKMSFICYHPTGTNHDVMIQLEYFRS